MATQSSSSTCTNLVDPQESKAFIQRCIEKCGSTPEHASCLADVVIEGDIRGHYSHGLNRLEMYANEILKGQCDGRIAPVIVKETPATALVDGQNGIGTVRWNGIHIYIYIHIPSFVSVVGGWEVLHGTSNEES